MKTEATEMFGLDFPLFGFSHCRDVVIALSKAGGLGVLGCARYSPEQFDLELSAIDRALGGRPYGVSIIFPAPKTSKDEGLSAHDIVERIPDGYWNYVRSLAKRFSIPLDETTKEAVPTEGVVNAFPLTREHAFALLEVVLKHPVKLVSSAVGAPPKDAVHRLHSHGAKVVGQVGDPKHVKHHIVAGVDVIVATGTEAGGHTGDIGSLVLTPQIVRAAAPIPVLTAGGVGTGKQVTAALALGAAGVWTGSAWLTTVESELPEALKIKLIAASASDTVRNRSLSGRMSRQLRTPWVEAWDEPGAPSPLPPPLQGVLVKDVHAAMLKSGNEDHLNTPVGQVVGELTAIRTVRQVVMEMMVDSLESAERVGAAFNDLH